MQKIRMLMSLVNEICAKGTPAHNIRAITAGLTPLKKFLMRVLQLYLSMSLAIIIMIINDGKTKDKVAISEPKIPPALKPA